MEKSKVKVLFLDDEENILHSLGRVFRKSPIEAVFSSDPDEAFELAKNNAFAVVVSDQRMPKLDGVDFLKAIQEISPDSVRIMLTGYADIKSAMRAVNEGNVFRFLAKPWSEEDLRAAIAAGVDQHELVQENRRLNQLTEKQNRELRDFNGNLELRVKERTAEIEKLNQELNKSFFSAIKIMGSLSGIIQPAVEGHSQRVAKIAGFLAKELQLSEREIYEVQVSAFIHNIGSVAPTSPDLSPELKQQEEVKLSAKIIALIPNIGQAPKNILHQLERFDGTGFPDKLAGPSIPIGARILAVASAFDKLILKADPRKLNLHDILQEIRKGNDTAFDPVILNALERYVHATVAASGKEFEVACNLGDLKPGMVISRPLCTDSGEILVSQGFRLNNETLESLWRLQTHELSVEEVYIYETSLPAAKKAA